MPCLDRTVSDPTTGHLVVHPVVFFHGNCPDGFAAALCAWQHFQGQGEYIPVTHGDTPGDVTGKDVYVLDITFDREHLEKIESQARQLVLLDHHKTAAAKLHDYRCRCGVVKFDLSKSAARMAWEHFNPGEPAPALISHVEDRDLVHWLSPESPAYLLALDAGPYNFYRWRGVLAMNSDKLALFMARGQAMHQFYRKQVDLVVDRAMPVSLLGHTGLLTNAPFTFHTDVGMDLARRCGTYGAVWCVEPQASGAIVRVGLRAERGFNTLPIAETFGGGGHPNSSAFRLPLSSLEALLTGRL